VDVIGRSGRARRRLSLERRLGLRIQTVDLMLKLFGPGQQRLVQFRRHVDRNATGLKVLAGLAAEAHVDE
jgi:hypothetical protein